MTSNNQTKTLIKQLEQIVSEGRNPNTMHLDVLNTKELLNVINNEDKKVAEAVGQSISQIAEAVDLSVDSIQKGGRLIYVGAGTSGRLGILDAVECRPTFSVPDDLVVGLIAGGEKALIHAVEGAEDNEQAAIKDLKKIGLNANDTLVGIAASGRTPYVISALHYANKIDCHTVAIVCNPRSEMLNIAKVGICAEVGPECLTGSTRMKSGTAQKLILNMLSTATMVKLGKVYENLMVDVNASNEKLKARALRIVMQATGCRLNQAQDALEQANNSAKLAILMLLSGQNVNDAANMLATHHGHLRNALKQNN